MRRLALFVVAAQAALVAAFAVGLRSRWFPLGVPGEWEWQRIKVGPTGLAVLGAVAGIACFCAFVAAGFRALSRRDGSRREAAWVLGLMVASVAVQGVVQEGAPEGYGLSKWIFALINPGSSGYYTVAKKQMADPARFLADYPAWIANQDALHVGTHPPGLFLTSRAILAAMKASPAASKAVIDLSPPSVSAAIRVFRDSDGLPRPDAAALALTGALTLFACASTVVPLYLLARATLSAPASWASAAFWPLVPSALLFQPTADTAFPLLSTSALALAAWAIRSRSARMMAFCVLSGTIMAAGMEFTLAFLPVGLVAALILATAPGSCPSRRMASILATGAGFLATTLAWWAGTSANPFAIWWANQRNHARFYVEYPRSYLAWVLANPVELAIALGLPATAWAVVGFGAPRQTPRLAWATLFVLIFLTISGKNLSEVARLWLPLMPPLLVAAGSGFERAGGGARTLAGSIGLVGVQALILEATIQVVYPV